MYISSCAPRRASALPMPGPARSFWSVKAEIQAIVDEAIRAKKVATRKKVATLTLTDSEQVIRGDTQEALQRAKISVDPAPKPSMQIHSGHGDKLPEFNMTPRIMEKSGMTKPNLMYEMLTLGLSDAAVSASFKCLSTFTLRRQVIEHSKFTFAIRGNCSLA